MTNKISKVKTQKSPKESNLPTGQAKPQLKIQNLERRIVFSFKLWL
ncbi:hypothetical protein J7L36_00185 [bacterium]|nr:hypothetical protein [bacterium]